MITTVPVVYLAHRVGAADRAGIARNLESARRWWRVLIELWPEAAVIAPWLTYVELLDDMVPAHRRRGLRDQRAVVALCNGITLTGPEVSTGMGGELDVALAARAFVLDLVGVDVDDRGTIRDRILLLGSTDPRALGEVRS